MSVFTCTIGQHDYQVVLTDVELSHVTQVYRTIDKQTYKIKTLTGILRDALYMCLMTVSANELNWVEHDYGRIRRLHWHSILSSLPSNHYLKRPSEPKRRIL